MESPFDPVRRRIERQGFTSLPDERLRALDPWIRFTPFLTALIATASTLTGSAMVLAILGAVTLTGAVSSRHPFDWLYERMIRPLENSPEFPRSGARRRLVFAVSGLWAVAAAGCFATGYARWGYALGLSLSATRAMVAALQICLIAEALDRVQRWWGKT